MVDVESLAIKMAKEQLNYFDLSETAQAALVSAARDRSKVIGYTHDFYKYPARFSPVFVRTAIETLTRPGELVLDPHVGGGTTLVEALACGRQSIGVDVSSLAAFVARVKTTLLTDKELEKLDRWASRVDLAINSHRPSKTMSRFASLGYYKHLRKPELWRLRKAIEQSLSSAGGLRTPHLVDFGRCVVLRTAQWALDGRRSQPTIEEFRKRLVSTARQMILGSRELLDSSKSHRNCMVKVFCRDASGIEEDKRIRKQKVPRLIITSPPYPGVHVLYHRWQIDGRKEVPLPFMIAGQLDGEGSSYYTMGDRKNPELKRYFEGIGANMRSMVALADRETIFVQVVAFSAPSWQLPRYLSIADDLGLKEIFLKTLHSVGDGRLWRSVPNRKWHANQKGHTAGSHEVVLFHRLK